MRDVRDVRDLREFRDLREGEGGERMGETFLREYNTLACFNRRNNLC